MKLPTIALTLALAIAFGAYRDAQGKADRRQDTIDLLKYQVSALGVRVSVLENRVRLDGSNIAGVGARVSRLCLHGRLVYDVSVSTFGGTGKVSPDYVQCY